MFEVANLMKLRDFQIESLDICQGFTAINLNLNERLVHHQVLDLRI